MAASQPVALPVWLSLSAALPAGPRLVFPSGGHNIQKTRAVEIADALVAWARDPAAAPPER